jgi:glycosyltransferase involved in cell wall biosynthesis
VFPSRHESYGLTLLEALAAGVPALCLDHAGARAAMCPDCGAVVRLPELIPALRRLLADDAERKRMGAAARAFAGSQPFSRRAAELAALLMS